MLRFEFQSLLYHQSSKTTVLVAARAPVTANRLGCLSSLLHHSLQSACACPVLLPCCSLHSLFCCTGDRQSPTTVVDRPRTRPLVAQSPWPTNTIPVSATARQHACRQWLTQEELRSHTVTATDLLCLVAVRLVGKGSFGSVYLVSRRRDGAQFVLKNMQIKNVPEKEIEVRRARGENDGRQGRGRTVGSAN